MNKYFFLQQQASLQLETIYKYTKEYEVGFKGEVMLKSSREYGFFLISNARSLLPISYVAKPFSIISQQ